MQRWFKKLFGSKPVVTLYGSANPNETLMMQNKINQYKDFVTLHRIPFNESDPSCNPTKEQLETIVDYIALKDAGPLARQQIQSKAAKLSGPIGGITSIIRESVSLGESAAAKRMEKQTKNLKIKALAQLFPKNNPLSIASANMLIERYPNEMQRPLVVFWDIGKVVLGQDNEYLDSTLKKVKTKSNK